MTTSRDELPKHAAMCALETGIEVTEDGESVRFDLSHYWAGEAFTLTAEGARLLADALLEAAASLEGQGFGRERPPPHT